MSQDENIYLMGLMWADGYVGKRYDIRLELKSPDFEYVRPLLQKYGFSSFPERQRYKNDKKFGNTQTQFCISNVTLNNHLQNLGYRTKSIASPTKVLSTIPKNKHYLWWRGFFDGDGCFYCNGATHTFAIWGSIDQDWSELKSLLNDLNIKSVRHEEYRRKNGTHLSSCIAVGVQDDIKTIGKYIYQNRMDIGFRRKYDKYIECISQPTARFQKRTSTKKGIYFSIWSGKWICRKTINKQRIVIGSFDSYQAACDAYDLYRPIS